MTQLPKARLNKIITQEADKELLIYDLEINKAFCLNETSALVWQLCDGKNSIAEISRLMTHQLKMPVAENLIWLALDHLKRNELLDKNFEIEIDFGGLIRREVIKKVGLTSMLALPFISSVVAPPSAEAQSGCVPFNGINCVSNMNPFAYQDNCCNSTQRCFIGGGEVPRCAPCLESSDFFGEVCFGSFSTCVTQCNNTSSKFRCCNIGPVAVTPNGSSPNQWECHCP